MTDYDPADNARRSYEVAVEAQRRTLLLGRSLEDHVKYELQRVLTTKDRFMPFRLEFKKDAPALWQDAAATAIAAIDEWREVQKSADMGEFACPIGHEGCTRFCGSYGCGG